MVDLHAHSDRSDGELSPRRLVELAARSGLSALAITDHDTVSGYDDAAQYAREQGVDLICGVELSARFRGEAIHVLGYFLDGPADEDFRAYLDELAATRRDRNERLAARLRELGLDVRLEEAEALGRMRTGRPHFARLLLSKGYVSDYRQAFDKYLDESAPGFVERDEACPARLFERIRRSGGIAVWAHPGKQIKRWGERPETIFAELSGEGLQAVECFHPDHDYEQAERYRRAAQVCKLAATGGSDFHRPRPAGLALGGQRLPDSLLADLREYHRAAGASLPTS